MRIAITGTHGSGKSTLIGDFLESHGGYLHHREPYWELAEQGIAFAATPNVADMEEQLEHSVTTILGTAEAADAIYDRCPVDFIAYLEVLSAEEGDEWEPSGRQLARIEKALASLDRIVFVPVRSPDEITARIERPALRRAVDRRLKQILRDDDLGLFANGPAIVEITGARAVRAAALSNLVAGGAGP